MMTPIVTPTIVPLVLVDDPTLVGSLVIVEASESDAVSVFIVNIVVKSVVVSIVINPAVVDMSAVGHGFLPSSGRI